MRVLPAFVLLGTGCLRETEFHCTENKHCAPGGICQVSVQRCSDYYPGCPSGQRFDDLAGPYAGQCAPPAECQSPYALMAMGTHLYMVTPAQGTWESQREFCAGTAANAYLAVPDTSFELSGIATIANTTLFWVGIHDQETEGFFVKLRGGMATYLPWATGEPNNGGGGAQQECVAGSATMLSDEVCNGTALRAVCECELP